MVSGVGWFARAFARYFLVKSSAMLLFCGSAVHPAAAAPLRRGGQEGHPAGFQHRHEEWGPESEDTDSCNVSQRKGKSLTRYRNLYYCPMALKK